MCLIADWALAVDAWRVARGTGWYWDAGEDGVPFAVERFYRGFDFVGAGVAYEVVRRELAEDERRAADGYFGRIFHDLGPGCPGPPGDLAEDAGVEAVESGAYYAMRPATVRAVRARARGVPWGAVEKAARDQRGLEDVRRIAELHEAWLAEAAGAGCGVVVLLSA